MKNCVRDEGLAVDERKKQKTIKSKLMEYKDTVLFMCEQRKEKCPDFSHNPNVLLELKQESFLSTIKQISLTQNR